MSRLKADLLAVRELLSDPSRWTKWANARDASGAAVLSSGTDAVCFCLDGAAARVTELHRLGRSSSGYEAVTAALYRAAEAFNHGSFIALNDDPATTHEDVLRLLDHAIEAANADA